MLKAIVKKTKKMVLLPLVIKDYFAFKKAVGSNGRSPNDPPLLTAHC